MLGGRLCALAATSPKRVGALPDLPAMAKALPSFEMVGRYGVIGPARMPDAIVAKLNAELVKILHTPEVRKRILQDGSAPVGRVPEDFRRFMLADLAK